ncbi:MAG: hypothetical protein JRH16_13405 [Deltaproteobacteria bacterium]|nr:hypothetical protein [Deltaproteobacteria bacterium]
MACAVFGAALAVGFTAARPLAPSRLHEEIEQLLSDLLGGDVQIGTLRLSLGWGIRLEGYDVVAWPSDDGPALHAERARAEIRPFSHLTGQRRLRSIALERPRLQVRRGPDGVFSPPPAERLLGREAEAAPPDELLQPLIAVESRLRHALETLVVADRFEILDGRIDFSDAHGTDRPELSLEAIRGSLTHSGFFDETGLQLAARLSDASGVRGSFEWDGRRRRDGSLRIAAAATNLQLGVLAPWLLGTHPDARLAANLSGAVVFDSPTPGHGRLELDLVAAGVESAPDLVTRGPLEAERVTLDGVAAISPGEVRLEDVQFTLDELGLVLDGALERPLVSAAHADLTLAVRDVTVRDLRYLVSWLPAVRRDEAERLLASIESGRLRLLRTAGNASLDRWQAFLAGRTAQLPAHFVVDAHLEDATLRVGEGDRMEDFSGRLWWTDDRVEIRDARALLNGKPLPQLDLSIDGVGHLFASNREARTMRDGAQPLVGLGTLWRATHREPGGSRQLDVRLELDHLEHPMFFWPVAQAEARVQSVEHGVSIAIERGRWAGVPVRGAATWLFEPEERVEAAFTAFPAPNEPLERNTSESWAAGRFEVGPIASDRWSQKRAGGVFRAHGGQVDVRELEIELSPKGRALASGQLDLSQPDAVPVDVAFEIEEGDLAQLGDSVGLPRDLASGTLSAQGSLSTLLRSDVSLSTSLDGTLAIDLRDGWIRQEIPAVAALALASAAVNPFAAREQPRFDRITTQLEIEAGYLRTASLTLDGPDVRAFASGNIAIAREPFDLDVEVVLYLFRPVDFVLEKIPLLNVLLLGPNDNLVAAHFTLSGPWAQPHASLVPHRSLTSGPGTMVFETMPALVRRGLQAIGSLMENEKEPAPEPALPPAGAAAPAES